MPIKFRWPQDINAIKFGSVLVWSVLGAAVATTVSGTSPLSLANALAKNIVSLTQYGKCTQASTPMPSSPVDIKCNNGALKWDSVNQRIYADGTPEVLSITAEDEYEGDIVTFDSPRLSNIAKLSVNLEPVQAGSGDPSPDNVRPISGWTGANVYHSGADTSNPTTIPITFPVLGKNLFDKDATPFVSGAYIGTATVGNQIATISHANYSVFAVPVNSGTTYTFGLIKASDPMWAFVDKDNLVLSSERNNGGLNGVSITRSAPEGATHLLLSVAVAGNYKCNDILQVEVGSSHTSYEPYTSTVYGGTLDVTTGVLTKSNGVVDMGSLDWIKVTDSGKTRFYAIISDMVSVPAVRSLNVMSSCYKTNIGGAWDDDKTIYNGGNMNRVYVYDSNYTEVSAFEAAVTGQSIVYPLAQPLTYQISPVTVNLLLGENNIWSDAGMVYIMVERAAKQTASVADLFAVGDYKDEQDIISGLLTHKVGIKVFDGTENWELHAAASGTYRLDGVFTDLAQNVPILSSLLCANFSATNTLATANFTTGMARWAATSDGSVAVLTSGTRLYACFGMSTVEAVK